MKYRKSLILGSIIMAYSSLASAQDTAGHPVIKIHSGDIQGIEEKGIFSFKGIPFAQPPVANLRWRAPQPVKPWTGVKDATAFGKSCMQTDNLPKSEDCLTLNVWTPALKPEKPQPVMVWIYRGALAHGNTPLYPLDKLAQQGVVTVSINY